MKKLVLLAAAAAAFSATPASAVTLLTDDFNAEALGTPQPTLTNFDVTQPTIDVIGPGADFGITCVSGNCIDLDGTPGVGRIVTKATFNYTAGLRYILSIAASGSQRSGSDSFEGGFILDGGATTISSSYGPLASSDPFGTYTFTFNPTTNGTFKAFLGGLGTTDNVGVVIDNFSLSGVPEPQTWALLILGIGMVGGVMRRRVRQTAKISFA